MNVLLLTHGSRGDVQPFIALAHGLAARGWRVRLAGPARFADLAAAYGVDYHGLDDSILDLTDLAARGGARAAVTAAGQVRPLLRRTLDTAADLLDSGGADVVVHHPKALAGPHLAEAMGATAVMATLMPLYVPTGHFPLPVLPVPSGLPAPLARSTWRLVSMIDAPYRGLIRSWRRDRLHLPARAATTLTTAPDGDPAPVPLHAWSPHLLPPPADWPPDAAPLGYWHTPALQGWSPPAGLARFLDGGDPPVYVGFGSMVGSDPAAVTRTVVEAVRLAGVRAVLATGWGGLHPGADLGPRVHVVDQVPHDWLLPRTACAVHHGGAGTVHAAARAGSPQVIRPFLADQPFWAACVHRAGLGPAPLPKRLSADRLAAAISTAVTDPGIARRTDAVRAAVMTDDGIGAAIRRLEAVAG
jgi:sterol 3beta-glucosyltransferase